MIIIYIFLDFFPLNFFVDGQICVAYHFLLQSKKLGLKSFDSKIDNLWKKLRRKIEHTCFDVKNALPTPEESDRVQSAQRDADGGRTWRLLPSGQVESLYHHFFNSL